MSGALRAENDVRAEINITPLVDVMLVLLVIFMVTAPALATRVDTRLPQPGTGPDTPPRMQLDVDAAGQWVLDGIPLSRAGVAERISTQLRQASDTVVAVRASPEADYQQFVDALALARDSGAREIATAP